MMATHTNCDFCGKEMPEVVDDLGLRRTYLSAPARVRHVNFTDEEEDLVSGFDVCQDCVFKLFSLVKNKPDWMKKVLEKRDLDG